MFSGIISGFATGNVWLFILAIVGLIIGMGMSHFRSTLKPTSIEDGVAEFRYIHPLAAKQLRRWWRAHEKSGSSS